MITLFACPKPFTDPHISLIQRNAIASWLALRPRPTVILFGDEEGVAEVCEELGLVHVPGVARNSAGTPLVNDVFRQAELMAPDRVVCYVNADIILMDDFLDAVRLCAARRDHWMMGGRPWDVAVKQVLTCSSGWQHELRDHVLRDGRLRWAGACDYFVYSKGLWGELPPFALGRSYFDLALLRLARRRGAALVDATDGVTAVHQSHPYPAHLGGDHYITNPEALENVRLAGGWEHIYTWGNATHRMTGSGIRRFWPGTLKCWGYFSPRMRRFQKSFWYPGLAITKPVRSRLGIGRDNLVKVVAPLNRLFRRKTGAPDLGPFPQ